MADSPEAQRSQNRGAWIIAGAIVVAAILIVGVMLYQNQQNRCAELREFMRETDLVMDSPTRLVEYFEAEEEYEKNC